MDRKQWLEEIGKVIDSKDAEKFASYITENGTFKFGNNDAVIGRKPIADYVAAFFTMIKSSQHKVVNCWELNGAVIWQGEVMYTRLDDRKVTVVFTNIFYMNGGLIDKYLIYIDNTPLFSE
jgi:hypothetical protein